MTAPPIDTGLDENARAEIAGGLSRFLADSYSLYLMNHNFHWNVTGPMFNSLHLMFMEQYIEQWNALDPIAERIRALGHPAPGTYRLFGALTSIGEVEGVPSSTNMIELLHSGQQSAARTARDVLAAADQMGDQPTADLLIQRLNLHEKNAWMLRSLLQ